MTGAVDDVWFDLDTEELVVVDYKATSSKDEVNLNKDWQISYKDKWSFINGCLDKMDLRFQMMAILFTVMGNEIKRLMRLRV